jgi:hypothetical protein
MLCEMLACCKTFKVADLVIERIPVDVMDVVARGDKPMGISPDVAVQ